MEIDKYGKDRTFNPNTYYCNICKVYCASATNLQTHFLGLKHKAVENALKAHGIVKPLHSSGETVRLPESLPEGVQVVTEDSLGKTLEEQLNSCKETEPALGLQYILEYRSEDGPIYECNLCICQGGLTNMFMHVLGIKHRMAYLKKHHPEIPEVTGRGSKLNSRLKEVAARVEEAEGRQPIRSTMDLPIPKDDEYSLQHSDSFVTWFSEEDGGKGTKKDDPKSKAKETDKTAEGDDSKKSEDKKESDQPQSTLFVESDSDSEEFTNNEALLKYLKSFEIVDEDDAAFILKVTQKFTDALILYREKASERKTVQGQNQYGNSGNHSAQTTSVGASGPHSELDFAQWELPAEQSFENMGTNSSVKVPAKRKASPLPMHPSKDKVKTSKLGVFVSTFKEIPKDPDSSDTDGPAETQQPRATPPDAGCLDAGRGPDAEPQQPRATPPDAGCLDAGRGPDAEPQRPRATPHDIRRLDAGRGPDAESQRPRATSQDAGRLDAGRGPDAEPQRPRATPRDAKCLDAGRGPDAEPQRLRGTPCHARRLNAGRGLAAEPQRSRGTPRHAGRLNAGRGLAAEPQRSRGTPCHAGRLNSGRGRASRGRQWQKAVGERDAPRFVPKGQGVPPSRWNRPGIPPSVPSQSESSVMGRFFSSIRNMEVDEVADTLQKITESNPAFSAPVGPRKTVWIIGHSIVHSAGVYADSSGWGTALGLEDRLRITWMGHRGMKWDDLLPAISLQVSLQGSPDALIIQLGEDDLPARKGVDLNITIAADLHTLVSRLPYTQFFWSDLLERREWPGATTSEKIDLVRRSVSAAAGRLIEATGGFIIRHPDINFKHTALYRSDGINLSEWGQDIWLHSIRHGLLCWLQS